MKSLIGLTSIYSAIGILGLVSIVPELSGTVLLGGHDTSDGDIFVGRISIAPADRFKRHLDSKIEESVNDGIQSVSQKEQLGASSRQIPPRGSDPKPPELNVSSKAEMKSTELPDVIIKVTSKPHVLKLPNVPFSSNYERDVSYFLEGHPAHSVHDPRVYFTDERPARSLAIMLQDLNAMPRSLRFSYIVRIFAEMGRKIATKLNRYSRQVVGVLSKLPDALGNKPEVSMLVDEVQKSFNSKEDEDPEDDSAPEHRSESAIKDLISKDKQKAILFRASEKQLGVKFARMMGYVAFQGCGSFMNITPAATDLLVDALKSGLSGMTDELDKSDKYHIPKELVNITNDIFNETSNSLHIFLRDKKIPLDATVSQYLRKKSLNFADLNAISDKTGLVGPWNANIFTNLGSAERVVKLFASLLTRVPVSSKSRWINMYWAQAESELERTITSFVSMQTIPRTTDNSELYLLDRSKTTNIAPDQLLEPRKGYMADKNRLPARCYLAGRRWRLTLLRAMKEYPLSDKVMKNFCDKISALKRGSLSGSGDELFRLCIPRLEVGLRGWGIDGEPNAMNRGAKATIRNPLGDLGSMESPFVTGAKFGYKIGFKIGYNEKRNATLEMELMDSAKKTPVEKASAEVHYLAAASQRKGATAGAKRVFGTAIKEGYLASMKVSLRAGIKIPAETGSRLASLRCTNFGGQAGLEAGRAVANRYLADKDHDEQLRKRYLKLGETHGLLGGELMGEAIGALVGKEAATEAYKRSIVRGGKISGAKFHMDEFEAGANLGFEYGIKIGGRTASSSNLDPSAPKFLKLHRPSFEPLGSRSGAEYVDHWENDLIPTLTVGELGVLHGRRKHIIVSGSLKGTYRLSKEVKRGLDRMAISNSTFGLDILADGHIVGDVAYLSLNGTVNKMSFLKGYLVIRDLSNYQ